MLHSTSQDKNLLPRALEGKISRNEFQQHVKDIIYDHNTTTTSKIECSVSDHFIDFGLSTKGPCPIVDKTQREFSASQSIVLSNTSKESLIFRFDPCAIPNNAKYELIVEPSQFKIKKQSKLEVSFRLRVFCTTGIYQLGRILVSHKEKKNFLKKKVPSSSSLKEEISGNFFYLGFVVESEVSPILDYDEIELGELISKGDHGSLFKSLWRKNSVAVKQLDNQKFTEHEKDDLAVLIRKSCKLTSPFLATHYGTTYKIPGNPFCIVMELVNGAPLKKIVENPRIDEKLRCRIATDIAKGLLALHSGYIFHKDLRLENIIIVSTSTDAPVHAKITNIGFYKRHLRPNVAETNYESFSMGSNEQLPKLDAMIRRTVDHVLYYSPEMFLGESISTELRWDKADIYALGMLLFGLFGFQDPASGPMKRGLSPWEWAKHVHKDGRLSFPPNVSPTISKLITRCWDQDPNKRPELPEIIKIIENHLTTLPDAPPSIVISEEPKAEVPISYTSLATYRSENAPVNVPSADPKQIPTYGPLNGINLGRRSPSPPPPSSVNNNNHPVSSSLVRTTQVRATGASSSGKKEPKDASQVAWFGEISREQAETLLRGKPDGTFLTRWSGNTGSYVLSYICGNGKEFKHVAGIMPKEGDSVTVVRVDSVVLSYRSLLEYIVSMQQARCITSPLPARLSLGNYDVVPNNVSAEKN